MAFTTIIVTGTYLEQDGETAASGTVTFMLTSTMRDTLDNITVSPSEVTATLDNEGGFSIELAATNDTYTTPRGVTYEVTERIDGGNENKFFISIDKDSPGGIVDIADLVPNITTVITQNYATKQYVDSIVLDATDLIASNITFTPTSEITSVNVQTAIEEVRAKSKYVHTQASASTSWTITHNLSFYPNVTIVDSGENYVVGDVQYTNENSLLVTFAHSFAGKAYLS